MALTDKDLAERTGSTVGSSGSNTTKDQRPKEEKSVDWSNYLQSKWEFMSNLPGGIYQSFTGEDSQVEFPRVLEIHDLIGSLAASGDKKYTEVASEILSTAKPGNHPSHSVWLHRDISGQIEWIKNKFHEDDRFKGIYSDKYGNPMLGWKDKAYYINKPGFSPADAKSLAAEYIQYFGPMKAYKFANTMVGKVIVPALTTIATETGIGYKEGYFAPKTSAEGSIWDFAKDTSIATGVDVASHLAPVWALNIARGLKKAAAPVVSIAGKLFPTFNPRKYNEGEVWDFLLTVGERMEGGIRDKAGRISPKKVEKLIKSKEMQLEIEKQFPKLTGGAAERHKKFRQNQINQWLGHALKIQRQIGSGSVRKVDDAGRPFISSDENLYETVASGLQKRAVLRAEEMKKAAGKSWEKFRAYIDTPLEDGFIKKLPEMSEQGFLDIFYDIFRNDINSGLKQGIKQLDQDDYSILKEVFNELKLSKANAIKNKKVSFADFFNLQEIVKEKWTNSAQKGFPENQRRILGRIKRKIDRAMFSGIEQGIITGDPTIINLLRKSKKLSDKHYNFIGSNKVHVNDIDERANKLLALIVNPESSVKEIVNSIFGHSNFNPDAAMGLFIKKIKKLPKKHATKLISLIKDGVLERAFSISKAGKISPQAAIKVINNSFDDVFIRNKSIANELFSPDELKRIHEFKNAANSFLIPFGYQDVRAINTNINKRLFNSLIRNPWDYLMDFPFFGTIEQTRKNVLNRSQLSRALTQSNQALSKPYATGAVAAEIRRHTIGQDPDPKITGEENIDITNENHPAVLTITEDVESRLNEKERSKLMDKLTAPGNKQGISMTTGDIRKSIMGPGLMQRWD